MNLESFKINEYANPVSSLPDNPGQAGMTAAQLKAAFDANATGEIKAAINAIIDDLVELQGDIKGIRVHEGQIEVTIDGENWLSPSEAKVDKVEGKQLSTNDYDNEDKQKVADSYSLRHSHDNKSVLDDIENYVSSAIDEAVFEAAGADMRKSVYDVQNRGTDIFEYVDAKTGTVSEDVAVVLNRIGESDSTNDTDVMGKLNNPKPTFRFAFNLGVNNSDTAFTTNAIRFYIVQPPTMLTNSVIGDGSGHCIKVGNFLYFIEKTKIVIVDIGLEQVVETVTVALPFVPTSSAELNGTIYMICGNGSSDYVNNIYMYNISTKTLTNKAVSGVVLGNYLATITNVNGVLYISASGKIYTCSPSIVLTEVAEFYDARWMSASVAVGDKIYYFNGTWSGTSSQVYEFNTVTKIVSPKSFGRSFSASTVSPLVYDEGTNCIYSWTGSVLLTCNLADNSSSATVSSLFGTGTPSPYIQNARMFFDGNILTLIGHYTPTNRLSMSKIIPRLAETNLVYPINLKSGAKVITNGCFIRDTAGNYVENGEIVEDGLYYIFGNPRLNFSIY